MHLQRKRWLAISSGVVACASALALTVGVATAAEPGRKLPPGGATWDYQIGGSYAPPAGTKVVSRDRGDKPAPGLYNICYVNAFQTQSGELKSVWKRHKGLLAKKKGVGNVPATADPTKPADVNKYWVKDGGWDEILLDTSTPGQREKLMQVVGPWIDQCARDGFDAVEPDNLDSWSRNKDAKAVLTKAGNVEFAKLLAKRAHSRGLAIAQKNTVELSPQRKAIGFDFAIAEECQRWNECGVYIGNYDRGLVFAVEYDDGSFANACRNHGDKLSIIRRDRLVRTPAMGGYLHKEC